MNVGLYHNYCKDCGAEWWFCSVDFTIIGEQCKCKDNKLYEV